MLGQRFKLIFLHGGSSKKREFNFTKKQFLLCAGAFALAFLLLSVMTGSTLYSWYSASRLSALTYKNSMLEKQLAAASEQIEELGSKIDQLGQHGSELRAYANLPLLDPEAQQMGIGGSLPYRNSMNFGAEELLAKIEQLDRQISLQENSLVEVRDQIEKQKDYLRGVPSIRPVDGGAFSSFFGRRRDPFTGRWEPHMGLDIRAPTGTPIYAAADGKIIHVRREPAYGRTVVIDHGNGYKTVYAHMNRFYVTKGQRVKRGDPIGEVGNTGRSTGPHLHYEVIFNNQHLNPLDFMFDGYAVAKLP